MIILNKFLHVIIVTLNIVETSDLVLVLYISKFSTTSIDASVMLSFHHFSLILLCHFYKYFHWDFFFGTRRLNFKRNTRLLTKSHFYTFKIARNICKLNFCSFIFRNSHLSNSILDSCFLSNPILRNLNATSIAILHLPEPCYH